MKRDQVKFPTRPETPVEIKPLGGTFTARSISLAMRLALRDLDETQFGPALLSLTILDEDGQPIGDSDQWGDFILAHEEEAFSLIKTCTQVNGFDDQKKA